MLRPVLEALQEVDRRLLRAMRTRYHVPQIEETMKALGMAGEWGAIWVAIGCGAAAADPTRRVRWLRAAAVAPAAVGVNYLVKLAVRRPRPRLRRLPRLAAAPTELSFPSAHATSSLAAAAAMGRVAPGLRPPLYGLAAAICVTRPYLGMHYPSDVLGGAAIGLLLGRMWPGLRGRGAEDRLIDLVASAAPSSHGADGRPQAPASQAAGGREPGRS
jgi:decaprenylphosphoryl-5-phosphoribose phosphatase